MTCNIEGLMLEQEIQKLTLECNHIKAYALSLPPYHQATSCATDSNTIATNTSCNEPSSSEHEFSLETTAVETRAMRNRPATVAELISPLHQHVVHTKERGTTPAGIETVCSFCNTGVKHKSDRCPLNTAIRNYINVDNQHALDSITENLGMPQEQQDL